MKRSAAFVISGLAFLLPMTMSVTIAHAQNAAAVDPGKLQYVRGLYQSFANTPQAALEMDTLKQGVYSMSYHCAGASGAVNPGKEQAVKAICDRDMAAAYEQRIATYPDLKMQMIAQNLTGPELNSLGAAAGRHAPPEPALQQKLGKLLNDFNLSWINGTASSAAPQISTDLQRSGLNVPKDLVIPISATTPPAIGPQPPMQPRQ